jgi:eukaryotic-like serine/threonine-protein kinase
MNPWLLVLSIAFAAPFNVDSMMPSAQAPTPVYAGDFQGAPVAHWVADLPGGKLNAATHTERSGPVIVGTSIFIGAAAGDGLYEVARHDGHLLRKFAANSSVESEPLITANRVYFSDTGGRTWCYTREGEELWQHQATAPILVRPTLNDGQLFITTVEDEAYALDSETGKAVWRYRHPKDLTREAELKLYGAPTALVDEKTALFGFSDGAVAAIDRKNGDIVWTKRVGEGRYPDIVATPTSDANDLYISAYYEPLIALDKQSLNIRWRLDIGAAAAPVINDNAKNPSLFHPGRDGVLRAIAIGTGAITWEWDSETSGALSTPIITDAGLLTTSSDGALYLVDPSTGVETWRYHEPVQLSGVTSKPAIDGRQLVFVTNAGKLYSMLSPKPQ